MISIVINIIYQSDFQTRVAAVSLELRVSGQLRVSGFPGEGADFDFRRVVVHLLLKHDAGRWQGEQTLKHNNGIPTP